jgi:hypothetical protein
LFDKKQSITLLKTQRATLVRFFNGKNLLKEAAIGFKN